MLKKLMPIALFSLLFFSACGDRSSGFGYDKAAEGGFGFAKPSAEEAPPPPPEVTEAAEKFRDGTSSMDDRSGNAAGEASKATANNALGLTNSGETKEAPAKIAEKIKKTADVNISVDDYKVARAAIEKIVRAGGGYISGENEQNSTYSISNSMIIRVANKDFDAMVTNLAGIASHVNSKNIYMEDVTAEFVDISARLKTKKEVEKRYIDLLSKASKVTDILEVEEQLRVIREEIEAKEGQLKLLNDQVAFSTINLNMAQNFEYTPQDEPGFFGRMGHAFGNGWKGFLSFVVGLVYVWPLWLILGLTAYFLIKFIKKKLQK